MKVLKVAVITAVVLLMAAGTGFAKTKGFYLGGSVGQGKVDITNGPSLTTDNVGYKIFGGYRFGLIGVEGSYVDFGNMTNGIPVDANTTAWDVFGVLNIALGPVDLFGKVGAVAWDLQVDTYKETDTDLAYGLGLAVRLGPLSIRGEYERFEIADTDEVGMYSIGLAYMF